MYIQEMNNSIEETSEQAIQQFPRFIYLQFFIDNQFFVVSFRQSSP